MVFIGEMGVLEMVENGVKLVKNMICMGWRQGVRGMSMLSCGKMLGMGFIIF